MVNEMSNLMSTGQMGNFILRPVYQEKAQAMRLIDRDQLTSLSRLSLVIPDLHIVAHKLRPGSLSLYSSYFKCCISNNI